jgi:hypothetical protein
MNIFALDNDPKLAASYHCDYHVRGKMILETAQIMSSALRLRLPQKWCKGLYLLTHYNHPCVVWAAQSYQNMHWLYRLAQQLEIERKTRCATASKLEHKSLKVIDIATEMAEMNKTMFPLHERTPFVKVVDERSKKIADPVEAYRNYYKTEKYDITGPQHGWRFGAPDWYSTMPYCDWCDDRAVQYAAAQPFCRTCLEKFADTIEATNKTTR